MRSSLRHINPKCIVIALVIIGALFTCNASALHAAAYVPKILVLNSYNPGYDWAEDEMTGVRSGLAKAFSRVDLYIEHLDTKKFHAKQHFPQLASLLEVKYAGRRLDVIIAMDNAALEFAARYRDRIAPGTPLVFCGINDFNPVMIAGQTRITGVAEFHDFAGTLKMALQLHPNAHDVIVIHDFTDTGIAIRHELTRTAKQFPAIRLHFMDEMPLEETVQKLRSTPADQLVLMLSYTVEKGGRTFSHSEAARLVSSASSVPVYSVYAEQLGNGVVGGRMMEGQIQGQKAAEIATRIIAGESPENIPVVTDDLSHPAFDYAVMKKFNIKSASLPGDAILINKPLSTFAVSKTVLWSGVLFSLLCLAGVVTLSLNVRKRRRLEEMLRLKIDQFQESQEELMATEEMLRAQVDEFMQSQDELHATEEMLRVQLEVTEESSRKFKAVFEHTPISVALTTLADGTFTEVNQAFINMLGYSREEALGKTTIDLGIWLQEADRRRYLGLMHDNGFVHNFEIEMRRKNGEVFPVLFFGVLLDIGGKPCVLSTVMEITEQKRLQNQLYQSQKMDVVGQLAGGIAHDFNNMLAGIMAAAELLKLRLSNDEKNQKMINTIINATTRSADLTRELLTFSRKGKSVSDPVNVNDVITAVMSLLERTVDKKIQLSSRLESGSPFVLGDQTQLQNTLLNLGVNARDAMPDGGALTYSTAVKVLDYATCRSLGISLSPGQYLEIAVSDTGIGMTKELLEHIFEPFFTTKAVGKGTGLGLSAVYGTVHSHNGELSVQSEPGVGSVFKIYIPLLDTVPQPTVCSVEAVSGSGVILLVDDEKLLRDIGSELLESLGYKVYLAENGEQALEVFAEHSSTISLVILDMMMPVMGGKEAFYSLRESSPELKILLCSGFSHDGTGDELVKLGANGFIQKPYNRSELSRSVAAVLGEL